MRLHLRKRSHLIVLLVLAVGALFGGQAFSQVTGATLSGTITDPSGAAVPGAEVTIENMSTQITRKALTDKDGLYTAPNLLPGSYEITVAASGFRSASRTGITLNVGGDQVIDITMKVGQVTETIEVTEKTPVVQVGSAELVTTVESRTVRDLPLNGRSWTELAALQPGVVRLQSSFNAASGLDRGLKGFGAQLSIGGGRPVQNNYRLDGVSVNDYANGGPTNVLGGALGVDAIQEFSVITSNYTAQYGRTSGGVINAITKSGTNAFHGSAYEFFRNSILDARNYFDYDTSGRPYRAPFQRNQFGGSAGGPIVKSRTFIFGDYEGILQSKGIATQAIVPSVAARNGDLTSGHVNVDPAAAQYLKLYALPNIPAAGDTGIYSFTGQQVLSENFFTTRIDHSVSAQNSISGTYMFDNNPYSAPDQLNLTLKGHHIRRQLGVVEWTHIFSPTLLNSFHVGGSRTAAVINQDMGAINPIAKDKSLAAIPGQYAARIFMSGFTNEPGGISGAAAVVHGYTSLQAYDDAFLTHGTHSLKFGVAIENIRNNTAPKGGSGDWSFGSLSDFLTNKPLSFLAVITQSPHDVHQTIFSAYIQDNWRVRKNLTLDLGLRYEFATVPYEIFNKYVTLIHLTDPAPKIGGQLFANPTLRNFEPRLGFAWDPKGDAKTVVHGAFGVFDVLPLPYVMDLLEANAAPFIQTGAVRTGLNGTFYAGGFPLLTAQTLNTASVEQHPRRNYVMTWNLNVQRQLSQNFAVIVGYMGSRGVHQQFKVDDSDMTLPTLTSAGYVFPYSTNPTTPLPTLNPNFGAIRSLWWNGDSSYNSLQIGATKHLSHGVQFQGSYTWSKSLDTSSSGAGSDSYGNSLSSLHWYDQRLNRSYSDFNTPRVLSLSAIWELPGAHVSDTMAQKFLGGWELGSIFTAQDGQPFTVLLGGDPLGQNSSDPFAFPNRLGGPSCRSLVNAGNINHYIKLDCFSFPTAPSQSFYNQYCNPSLPFPLCTNLRGNARRNILSGPGFYNLDFSVYKNTAFRRISETFSTQFRVEFFNVLNHPNFQAPLSSNTVFDSVGNRQDGAGAILGTTNDSREIQLAFKVIW